MRALSVSRMVRLVDGSLPKDVTFSIKKNKKNPPFIRESTLQPSFNDLIQNVGDLLLSSLLLWPQTSLLYSPPLALNLPRILPKPACCLLPSLLSQSPVPLISLVDSTNMEKTPHQSEESPQSSVSVQHNQNEPSLHSILMHTEYLLFTCQNQLW